ncbi:MAG: hypothetical protein HFJ37_04340 [Clostridia bacterium]|nr:hypothetical protein [Clostridia bacterium]
MMIIQLCEHWRDMSYQEIFIELVILFVIIIFLGIVIEMIERLKQKYEDKVMKLNSRILKFIFRCIK